MRFRKEQEIIKVNNNKEAGCRIRSIDVCMICETECRERIRQGIISFIYHDIKRKFRKILDNRKHKTIQEASSMADMLIKDMYRAIGIYTKYHRKVEYLNEEMGGVIVKGKRDMRSVILENISPDRNRHFKYGRMDFITELLHWRREGYKYTGEWHTHPRRLPDLTARDHRAMKWKAMVYGKVYLIIARYMRHKIYYGVYVYNRFGFVSKKGALYYKVTSFKSSINDMRKRRTNDINK